MTRTPRDLCKGCRECYTGIISAVVKNPFVAGIMMGIPSYFMLASLLFDGSIVSFFPEYYSVRSNVSAPFYTLLTFTIVAWVLEMIAMKMMMPNLLSMCAFGHSSVGSWWLVNFGILMFAGWAYVPIRIMFVLMIGVLTPAVVWHITGDIIRGYKQKMIDEIQMVSRSLAMQAEAFNTSDPEIAMGRPK
jgi:hypothetical protein